MLDISQELKEKIDARQDDREAEIILLRLGSGGEISQTSQEIGARFGISRERVRQIKR